MNDVRVLATGLRFPEGPVVLPDGSIAFVEIARGRVARVKPDGTVTTIAETGGGPNGLALGPDGALYVCNNGGSVWREENGMWRSFGIAPDYRSGSIQRVDPGTGTVSVLYDHCGEHRLLGPNDLVFDGFGGFYFTDFGRSRARDRDWGGVYYALADGSRVEELVHPLLAPNGIALSPDGRTLYVAETDTARVWAWPIEAPGVLRKEAPFPVPHGGRLLVGLGGFQRLDSMAVQANGDICVATFINGGISVVDANGGLLRHVKVPDIYCTNICFGGTEMRTAYITLAETGRLIAMEWPDPGLRLAY